MTKHPEAAEVGTHQGHACLRALGKGLGKDPAAAPAPLARAATRSHPTAADALVRCLSWESAPTARRAGWPSATPGLLGQRLLQRLCLVGLIRLLIFPCLSNSTEVLIFASLSFTKVSR